MMSHFFLLETKNKKVKGNIEKKESEMKEKMWKIRWFFGCLVQNKIEKKIKFLLFFYLIAHKDREWKKKCKWH